MFDQIPAIIFVTSGLIVALLLAMSARRLGSKDRNAAAAAAIGFFLCSRYAELIHGTLDLIFAAGVGLVMVQLAYDSLGFRNRAEAPAE